MKYHHLLLLIAPILLNIVIINAYHQCQSSPTKASGTQAPGKICRGQLIFEDNFNNFNFENWQHEVSMWGGGNGEFQWYTNNRKNSRVKDGKLQIIPTLTADDIGEDGLSSATVDLGAECTNSANNGCKRTGTPTNIINPLKSAKLFTRDSFSFRYGRVEVSAKLPLGDWIWPAIWMMPKDSVYGEWPRSGEIDIMESRGNRVFTIATGDIGVKLMGSTMHWGPEPSRNAYTKTHWEKTNEKGFNSDFHKYEFEWTPDTLIFRLDGVEIGRTTPPAGGFWEKGEFNRPESENLWINGTSLAPFDQEFYLIINLAVGGVNWYFPDGATNPGGKPWSNTSPQAMAEFWNGKSQWLPTWGMGVNEDSFLQVDYVRVYAL